jgi:hypothetical protein
MRCGVMSIGVMRGKQQEGEKREEEDGNNGKNETQGKYARTASRDGSRSGRARSGES